MFISKELVFIELHKSGSTHITKLLFHLLAGKQVGKHNPASEKQIEVGKFFVTSIRNPWEWYVSLWSYGNLDRGLLKMQLTRRKFLRYLLASFQNPIRFLPLLKNEFTKDTRSWEKYYSREGDPAVFRKWLHKLLDPNITVLPIEGFKNKKAAPLNIGLYTHRYLQLCCIQPHRIAGLDANHRYGELVAFDQRHCYINFFIRFEHLEAELCEAIERVRGLSEQEKSFIYNQKKTNESGWKMPLSRYYDSETIELIAVKDRLLIEKFDYKPGS